MSRIGSAGGHGQDQERNGLGGPDDLIMKTVDLGLLEPETCTITAFRI